MALFGLDIEQVRQLATTMQADSQTINELVSKLTSQLGSVQWQGPDAERFRDEWSSTLAPALNRVSQELTETANRATQNAAQQESASNS